MVSYQNHIIIQYQKANYYTVSIEYNHIVSKIKLVYSIKINIIIYVVS